MKKYSFEPKTLLHSLNLLVSKTSTTLDNDVNFRKVQIDIQKYHFEELLIQNFTYKLWSKFFKSEAYWFKIVLF